MLMLVTVSASNNLVDPRVRMPRARVRCIKNALEMASARIPQSIILWDMTVLTTAHERALTCLAHPEGQVGRGPCDFFPSAVFWGDTGYLRSSLWRLRMNLANWRSCAQTMA